MKLNLIKTHLSLTLKTLVLLFLFTFTFSSLAFAARMLPGFSPLEVNALLAKRSYTEEVNPGVNLPSHSPLAAAIEEELSLTAEEAPFLSKQQALTEAITMGEFEKTQTLLEGGLVDPNSRDSQGLTPLLLAARLGYTEIVDLLLKRRAKPNERAHHGVRSLVGYSPLLVAARFGHLDIVKTLLASGATLDEADHIKLRQATLKGHHDCVDLIIKSTLEPSKGSISRMHQLFLQKQPKPRRTSIFETESVVPSGTQTEMDSVLRNVPFVTEG